MTLGLSWDTSALRIYMRNIPSLKQAYSFFLKTMRCSILDRKRQSSLKGLYIEVAKQHWALYELCFKSVPTEGLLQMPQQYFPELMMCTHLWAPKWCCPVKTCGLQWAGGKGEGILVRSYWSLLLSLLRLK